VTRTVFDDLIVEEPMTIQLDGAVVSTTMRTPATTSSSLPDSASPRPARRAPITGVRYCASGSAVDTEFNVVAVETGGHTLVPTARLGTVSSSCGWCGSEQLDVMCERLEPLPPSDPFDLDVLASIPHRMSAVQGLFAATGAVHAAAAFDRAGEVLVTREDVGRHNAVDKVVGSMLLGGAGGLPATDLGLFVSGRASIEMVQKAWAAGFSTLVAVSAPTALAVDAARRADMVLAVSSVATDSTSMRRSVWIGAVLDVLEPEPTLDAQIAVGDRIVGR